MAYAAKTIDVIERTEINPRYELHLDNAVDIYKSSQDVFHQIDNAFKFGYAQGMKAAHAAQRKAARA